MLLKRAAWVVVACLGLAALIWQPFLTAVAVGSFIVISLAVLTRPRHGLAFGLMGAATVLILIPTTEVEDLPGGSLYGPIVASGCLLFGLIKQGRDVQVTAPAKVLLWLYTIMVVSTFAVGTIDWFYLPFAPVGALAFLSAVNLNEWGRKAMAWYILGMAVFQAVLAIPEVLRGAGPFIGTQIPITVINPFMPSLDRAQGTLDHPLVLSIIFLLGLSFLHVLKMPGLVRFGIGGLLLVGVFLTGSSSTAVTAGIVVLWTLADRKSVLGKFFVRAALAVAAFYALFGGVALGSLADDMSPQNLAHRLGSVEAIPSLLTLQHPYEVIFGNGVGPVKHVFESNLIANDGFFVIDNQFVAVLVAGGVVGAGLLVWLLFAAFKRAPKNLRPAVIVLLLMTASFDYLLWYSLLVPVFLVLGMALTAKPAPEVVVEEAPKAKAFEGPAAMYGRSPAGAMR